VRLSAEDCKPETRIEIDREKMAAFGLSIAEVGAVMIVGVEPSPVAVQLVPAPHVALAM